jgi:hypothetical protein
MSSLPAILDLGCCWLLSYSTIYARQHHSYNNIIAFDKCSINTLHIDSINSACENS